MQTIYFKKADDFVNIPEYKTENSVGADLESNEDVTIKAGSFALIKTGLFPEIPNNLELQVRARSGLAAKNGIFVLNGPGTIDPDYTGEIGVILGNFGKEDFVIKKRDRIAQIVASEKPLVQFKSKKEIKKTERGDGGFGHTGK